MDMAMANGRATVMKAKPTETPESSSAPAPGRDTGYDPLLLAVTVVLCLFGILMVYSSSAVISMNLYGSAGKILFKHLVALGLGTLAAFACAWFDYRRLRDPRLVYGFLGLTAVLLVALMFLPMVRGTRRWFRLGSFAFEPSELAKLAVIVFLAYMLEKKRGRVHDFVYTLLPIAVILATIFVFILVQPDLGTSVSILAVAGVMLFAAGLPWSYVLGGTALFIPAFIKLILMAPYRRARLLAFLSPWADPQGYGFQPIQALIALGSGGITGVGPGESVQKLFYLPEPHTDFVFAVIGEELGLIGCVLVLALYLLFAWRGVRAALRADNDFGFYLATGVTAMIAFQVLVNISVALSLVPAKGLPLPFISAGGSSLITCLAATGLLLNVSSRH
jgi:cell division protein FtsW